MHRTPKSFNQTQAEWYDRLERDGFVDIEDHTQDGRPLKRWTGIRADLRLWRDGKTLSQMEAIGFIDQGIYQPELTSIQSSWPDSHLSRSEEFLIHPEFPECCQRISKHGNNAVTREMAKVIWELYATGSSTRIIEGITGIDHVTAFRVIKRLTEWMNLLESMPE